MNISSFSSSVANASVSNGTDDKLVGTLLACNQMTTLPMRYTFNVHLASIFQADFW